ncbi:hypothetical protein ACFQE0_13655 [Methylobacterium komagatae]|uniref:Uncharacterized protein n=1 Tax=Methylobacterium komagatae TaxID=374425 RepID=A0ABW2BJF9_9HYPH
MTDPHMISDAALDALYSDDDTLARAFACEHTGDMTRETWARIQADKPAQARPFLLALKRGLYRETGEYTQAALNARMARKPRPKARPMAGPWCGWR